MLAVSAILLLTFLTDKKQQPQQFYCKAQDVNLIIGESAYNYYQLSHQLAIVQINVEKENIIEIDNDKITAIGIGSTKVTLSASYGEEHAQTTFTVKVTDNNYTLSFNSTVDCYFRDSTLYAKTNICQFGFEVYDSRNVKMPSPQYEIVIDGDGSATKSFYGIVLSINSNCTIILVFTELEFEFTINAVLI